MGLRGFKSRKNSSCCFSARHAIPPKAVERATQDNGAIPSNISSVSKTDTVVIGNGPSALALSYLLHGNEPWYTPSESHPDTVLHRKLLKKALGPGALAEKPQDIRLYDVLRNPSDCDDLTSHFPAAASMSYSTAALPLNTLLDTLLRPLADIDLEECVTRIAWKKTADVVPHVILGEEGRAGGQWAGDEVWFGDEEGEEDDNGLKTLSYAHLLSLPGYSVADHYRVRYGKEMNPYHRPTRRLVADYYASYPRQVGIEDVLYPGTSVTNVERIDDKSGFNFLVSIKLKNQSSDLTTATHVIRCRNVVLATGIFSHRIPAPAVYSPFFTSRPAPSGVVGNDETSAPLLVVGSGYTAADAILCNRGNQPVIHVYRWQPDDRPSPLRGCHPQAYPGYAGVYRQMKEAALGKVPVSDGRYEGFPNAIVTETTSDGTVTISFKSSDGVEKTVVRKVADIKVCIGRRGRLDYLAPTMCKEIGIKNLDYDGMDKESSNKIESTPIALTKTVTTATVRRHSRSHKPTLHPTTSHTAGKVWVQHNSIRERVEQNVEVAPNVFVIGSLTGDSLVRFAMGGCVYSAGRIVATAGPIPESSSDSSEPSSETSSLSETGGVVIAGDGKRRRVKCAIV
ncbi:hypothetical protein ABW21_db0204694 [Orbilia brochopaga]|nr:hypothetical protein ABW21_db0204694 [Drechslerella brochopaga]